MSKQLPGNGQPQTVLKNDFRDELEQKEDPIKFETDRVGEKEMLRRDQYITLIHLEHEKIMREGDVAHLNVGIASYTKLLEELQNQPLCEAREGIIQVVEQQIQRLEKQLAQSTFPRVNVISLEALRSVFRVTEIGTSSVAGEIKNPDKPDGESGVGKDVQDNSDDTDDELTAPDEDSVEEAI